ncbi:MAG: serine/threonine protein phosphatase [Alphaproteobacteria bacterium]|nr:serine/threonine protein phosphatase [Alphaproteobacteria bacterium]NDC57036.1 serine/threonine protein phosphatase [Alphaproteobacteria bacterium]
MFSWLKDNTSQPAAAVKASVGDAAVYAVGDVHGRHDLLNVLLKKIADHAGAGPQRPWQLVFLGDYIDRGFESRQVIDACLKNMPPLFQVVFLRGNHEESMMKFLEGDDDVGANWLHFGGRETLYSYGVELRLQPQTPHEWHELRLQFAEKVPADHIKFLQQTQLMHCVADYAFVHAGIKPGVPLSAQQPRDLMWIRGEFLRATQPHEKIIVHGHTIAREPEILPNRIGIDTGAFATGRLTCLYLHQDVLEIIST